MLHASAGSLNTQKKSHSGSVRIQDGILPLQEQKDAVLQEVKTCCFIFLQPPMPDFSLFIIVSLYSGRRNVNVATAPALTLQEVIRCENI